MADWYPFLQGAIDASRRAAERKYSTGDFLKDAFLAAGKEFLARKGQQREDEQRSGMLQDKSIIDAAKTQRGEYVDILKGFGSKLTPESLSGMIQGLEQYGPGFDVDNQTGRVVPRPYDLPDIQFREEVPGEIDLSRKQASDALARQREQSMLYEKELFPLRKRKLEKELSGKDIKAGNKAEDDLLKALEDYRQEEKLILDRAPKITDYKNQTRILEENLGPKTKKRLEEVRQRKNALYDEIGRRERQMGLFTEQDRSLAEIFLRDHGKVVTDETIDMVLARNYDDVVNYQSGNTMIGPELPPGMQHE